MITVVIPVYNGEDYLGQAIESVLAQSYRDFEVLVVDDGSSDGTRSIIARYSRSHPQQVRGLHKANGGTATALNAGIRDARGEYVAWLSHDDRFVPHKLAAQMQALQAQPAAVGVYSDYSYIDAEGEQIGYCHSTTYPPERMMRHLLQSVFINGSTLLVQRRCLIEVGLFDESLRYAQDAMMWLQLTHRYQLIYIPQALTEYRLHRRQGSYTHGIWRNRWLWRAKAVKQFTLEEIFPELTGPTVSARDRAAAYTYLGDMFLQHAKHPGLSLCQYVRAWRAWPHPRNPALRHPFSTIWRSGMWTARQLLKRGPDAIYPVFRSCSWLEDDMGELSTRVKDIRLHS